RRRLLPFVRTRRLVFVAIHLARLRGLATFHRAAPGPPPAAVRRHLRLRPLLFLPDHATVVVAWLCHGAAPRNAMETAERGGSLRRNSGQDAGSGGVHYPGMSQRDDFLADVLAHIEDHL